MSCRICILLLLLSTTCHSQEKVQPNAGSKFDQLNSEIQRMQSAPQQATVPAYLVPGSPGKVSVEDLQLPPKAARELQRSQKAFHSVSVRGVT
jgi:hypothetical protein